MLVIKFRKIFSVSLRNTKSFNHLFRPPLLANWPITFLFPFDRCSKSIAIFPLIISFYPSGNFLSNWNTFFYFLPSNFFNYVPYISTINRFAHSPNEFLLPKSKIIHSMWLPKLGNKLYFHKTYCSCIPYWLKLPTRSVFYT